MFPIFTVSCLDDKLLIGGGGGSTKAGVNNTLKLYNTDFEISTTFKQDAVMAATFHPFDKIVLAAVGSLVKIYKVGSDFEFLKEISVSIPNEYEFVKKLVFSSDGNHLIVLVSDGSWLLYEYPSLCKVYDFSGKIENFDANFVNDSRNIIIVTSGISFHNHIIDDVTIYNSEKNYDKSWQITNANLSYLSEKCDFRGAR
jgi:WD40 repeat protein